MVCSSLAVAEQVLDPTKPKQLVAASAQTVTDEDAEQQVESIRLQGVLDKKGLKLAIISGELYNKGDKIDGYLIREIHNNYVVLVGSGTQKRLYVYE